MVEVKGEITIARPVDEVFDFVANEENEPRYNPHMRLAEKISEGATGPGTRFRTELRTMGRTMPMIVEFTAYERPGRLASVTRSSMMQTEGALTFDPVAWRHADALVVERPAAMVSSSSWARSSRAWGVGKSCGSGPASSGFLRQRSCNRHVTHGWTPTASATASTPTNAPRPSTPRLRRGPMRGAGP